MNPFLASIIMMLLEHVKKVGDEYLERGLRLLMDALLGRVTDEQLIAFLRERAEGGPG